MTKVDKLTSEAMMWMNSAMNQQSKQSLSVDPCFRVKDILAKTRVSDYLLHILTPSTVKRNYNQGKENSICVNGIMKLLKMP